MKLVKSSTALLVDLRELIQSARMDVARQVNSALVMLYWQVGKRIREDLLHEKRAEYGQEILQAVSAKLTEEFGRGFSQRNLASMVRFAETFPDEDLVNGLRSQLSWSHFTSIIYLNDPLRRDFYAEMCRLERWSTRTLETKINHLLYERTAVAKKPKKVIEQEIKLLRKEDELTPDLVFRDPYFLDFLKLRDGYIEKDIEDAIMREMESFILELGTGFTFVARQKRITVDSVDYYLDLLFYHRKLRRLVAIDLKLDRFKAEYKGQMELYLRWLEKHEKQTNEGSPIGLILCAGKSDEHIELLELGKSGVRVAAYMTDLPPKDVLEKKLHQAILFARERLARKQMDAGAGQNRKLLASDEEQP